MLQLVATGLFMVTFFLSGCVTSSPEKPLPYLKEQADFFMQAGIESHAKFNYALASEQFSQAHIFYKRYDDYLGNTQALLNLAQVDIATGHYNQARQNIDKASQLIQLYHLNDLITYRDLLLTHLYLATDKPNETAAILARYDLQFRSTQLDDTQLALLINRVALAQLQNRDFSMWLDRLRQQPGIQDNIALTARLQRFIAWQAFLDRDMVRAAQSYSAALADYRQQANPAGLMATRLDWALACETSADWEQAAQHYEQALQLAMSNTHLHNGVRALEGLNRVYPQTAHKDKMNQVSEWMRQLELLQMDTQPK